ncbi:ATP-dependent zinc protease [Thiomicrorhabdus aquaedulcis]|uniref:ATP-dependent zinc protease family protein n=1 Tax=Thiomicrorhabdus aquaedulcis TaxID=2211106 RepID=UPI000FD8585F|nr:RimK/LysX family protein [Thiomicrorhabdus aquaedulcis]
MLSRCFSAGFKTIILLLLAANAWASSVDNTVQKPVIGWIETVDLPHLTLRLSAKIDSGADHSSLHATDITLFTQNDQAWVRFTTLNNTVHQQPLLRMTHIKAKPNIAAQPDTERPVIALSVCLGSQLQTVPVNLVNRQAFSTPMLLGRSALQAVLIDSARQHLAPAHCPGAR